MEVVKIEFFLELHIIHVTSIQSVGKDIGHHPLCVGDHNDITIQKPVCNSQYSYVYSRLGLHLIVSLDYLSGKSVGKKYSRPL